MKIDSMTLYELHMPLVHFFETSFGRTYERRILLVRVDCDGANLSLPKTPSIARSGSTPPGLP